MRATSAGRSPAAHASALTPLERSCARSFRDAISHLHDLILRLDQPAPNTDACRRELEAVIDHTCRLSAHLLGAMTHQGMRVDPGVRQLFCRCAELAARVHRAIQRARTAARQARFEADLFSQEQMSPGWEA